ncbi:MAG: PIN domain-containing protein [Acidobacteria bacterium]|nr:PIN domain-containing protein [Acidobacteriota bacterium]
MIAIDTNLLVYAHRSGVPEHAAARAAIERAANSGRGWGIAAPCLAEFWSVVTHPSATGRPSEPGEAQGFVRSLVEDGGARLWRPGPGFGRRLLQIAADLAVSGVRIFDLQIALTAFDNGAAELWTQDRNFTTVPGLAVEHPLN